MKIYNAAKRIGTVPNMSNISFRYIPDDPYKKYNDLPFHIYKWTKLKNAENIRLYGNNTYR